MPTHPANSHRHSRTATHAITAAALVAAAATAPTLAQDSVATTPGENDALDARSNAVQQVRFALDLAPATTSWGDEILIGPLTKTSQDANPLFRTQVPASLALSATPQNGFTFPSPAEFAAWESPGAGINPDQNTPAATVSVAAFDHRAGFSLSDVSGTTTNAIALEIGRTDNDPDRLFVTRTIAAVSGLPGRDLATLTASATLADGTVLLRADDNGVSDPLALLGENAIRVDPAQRDSQITNAIFTSSGVNGSTDPTATDYDLSNGSVTIALPTLLDLGQPDPQALIPAFDDTLRVGTATPTTAHLDPATGAVRGGLSFSPRADASAGFIAQIAIPATTSLPNAINIAELDQSGTITQTHLLELPSPISTDPFSANQAGNARFGQYESQASFRGPLGTVAIPPIGDDLPVAAVATAAQLADFIAIATAAGGNPAQWDIAAYPGQPVLDGPQGTQIGTLASQSQTRVSPPAIDRLGRVYFVAEFDSSDDANDGPALFRANPDNDGNGFHLERLTGIGDGFIGINSQTPYQISNIVLEDTDGVGAGAFGNASLLDTPGLGLLIVLNAEITYDRSGILERYNATLAVADPPLTNCPGDTDGSGSTGLDDLLTVLSNFGSTSPAGGSDGDLDGDGVVGLDDLLTVLADFGCGG